MINWERTKNIAIIQKDAFQASLQTFDKSLHSLFLRTEIPNCDGRSEIS